LPPTVDDFALRAVAPGLPLCSTEIRITGEDAITWDTAHPREGWKSILGHGHYHETCRVEDGAWLIATLTLTRISLAIQWPEGALPA
jgi:hypothetical protein